MDTDVASTASSATASPKTKSPSSTISINAVTSARESKVRHISPIRDNDGGFAQYRYESPVSIDGDSPKPDWAKKVATLRENLRVMDAEEAAAAAAAARNQLHRGEGSPRAFSAFEQTLKEIRSTPFLKLEALARSLENKAYALALDEQACRETARGLGLGHVWQNAPDVRPGSKT